MPLMLFQRRPIHYKRLARLLAVAFLVASCGLTVHLINGDNDPSNTSQSESIPEALTVQLEQPKIQRWERSLVAQGTIEPWQELVVSARSNGLPLAEVYVNVGDTVKRGALLARFDAALPRAEMLRLEATLAQATAQASHATNVRERMEVLSASGAVSRQDVQQAQTQAATMNAQIDVVKAELAARRLLLSYADVRAPEDGVVSSRTATAGTVSTSDQELFRLIRQHRLEWRGQLTAQQVTEVRPGQVVDLALPSGGSTRAVVRQDAPRLDPQTRLATVFADISTRSGARAGMYASGRITLDNSEALTVAAHSIVVRDGFSWVFIAEPGKRQTAGTTVRAAKVMVGRRRGRDAEILSGLDRSRQVVGQGAAFLKDGDVIHIAQVQDAPVLQGASR